MREPIPSFAPRRGDPRGRPSPPLTRFSREEPAPVKTRKINRPSPRCPRGCGDPSPLPYPEGASPTSSPLPPPVFSRRACPREDRRESIPSRCPRGCGDPSPSLPPNVIPSEAEAEPRNLASGHTKLPPTAIPSPKGAYLTRFVSSYIYGRYCGLVPFNNQLAFLRSINQELGRCCGCRSDGRYCGQPYQQPF